MKRIKVKENNGILEIVTNDDGVILFAKKTTVYQGYNSDRKVTTISGYGRVIDFIEDLGFTHLQTHDFPKGAVVDYQYVATDPENELSSDNIGSLTVYDGTTGKAVSGESFTPSGFTRTVMNGKSMENPDGIMMSAPELLKLIFGENIKDYMNKRSEEGR